MPNRLNANNEGLLSEGGVAYSAADKSCVRIDGLKRDLAVSLAHAQTVRLDATGATGREFNVNNYFLRNEIEIAQRRSIRKEQTVFSRAPALGNFVVRVMLPERSDMEALGIQ